MSQTFTCQVCEYQVEAAGVQDFNRMMYEKGESTSPTYTEDTIISCPDCGCDGEFEDEDGIGVG